MTSKPRRAIDIQLAGLGRERFQTLIQQDRDMAVVGHL
jgi:hypothetical protein